MDLLELERVEVIGESIVGSVLEVWGAVSRMADIRMQACITGERVDGNLLSRRHIDEEGCASANLAVIRASYGAVWVVLTMYSYVDGSHLSRRKAR